MRAAFVANEVGIGLWRNLMITISVIIVTAVSLVFFGGGLLAQRQVDLLKGYWYDRVQVSTFLCPANSQSLSCGSEVTAEQRDAIEAELKSPELAPYVETYFYESKEEAYQRFTEQFANTAFIENVTPDQLPESFRVRLVDPEQSDVVVAYFQGRAGVDDVDDQRQLLDGLFQLLDGARRAAWILAGIMLVAATLLVVTTIRLAAFNRRRETGIMRLVGASKFFIQLPFMLEGIVAAALGAALATIGLFVLVRVGVQNYVSDRVQLSQYVSAWDVLAVAPVIFAVGILLAGVSSFISLQRYLRV